MFRSFDAESFAKNDGLVEMLPRGFGHRSVRKLDQRDVLLVEENLDAKDVAVNAEQREQFIRSRLRFVQIRNQNDGS